MIELRDLSIVAGGFRLEGLRLTVGPGEYVALMGRTGQGKTTILEAICGLRRITAGSILIRNRDVTDWPPGDRRIGYVPQDRALFPTMTVRENLEFALKLRKTPSAAMRQRVDSLAEVLGITPLLHRGIRGLSGGESQRVALGRALSFEPDVLLLDEPLSALDDSTRLEVQRLLAEVTRNCGVTTIHVTHRRDEAESLADRVYLLREGGLSVSETGPLPSAPSPSALSAATGEDAMVE